MTFNRSQITLLLIGIGLLIHGVIQINGFYADIKELEQISEKVPFQKGMSFTTWDDFSYNSTWVREEFDKMKAIGIEWLAINHWWWQDYLNSTEIKQGPWSDGFANMTDCFLYAKSIGLHIMYKPMLNLLKTYDWRSYITYTDDWMANYTSWMVENAKAAEAGGVEILCFGTEMGNMQVHSDEVREMIGQIRAEFSGLLTYSANHDSFKFIDWYDAIDIIGISMYSMMTTAWDPSVDELTTVWDGMYHDLRDLALQWNKPIMFTETGIQAMDGSNMIPNDNQISQEKDVSEMENFYLSLFNSKLWSAFWFKGAYWWIWDQAQAEDSTLKSFNPVIIQDIIKAEYAKDHIVVGSSDILIKLIVPLACGLLALLFLVLKSKTPLLPIGDDLLQSPQSQNLIAESNGNAKKGHLNPSNIAIGLVLGALIATLWTNLTLGLFNIIHRSFSYAVILQISLTNIILIFVGILALGFFISLALTRYVPRLMLLITSALLLFTPYFALSGSDQAFFVDALFDFLIVFLMIGVFIIFAHHFRIERLMAILSTAIIVLTLFFICVLIFDKLSNTLLSVALFLAAYIMSNGNNAHNNQSKPREVSDVEKSNQVSETNTIPKVPMLLLIVAFLAGILIPFGNSAVNLIAMNYLSLKNYYVPSLVGGIVILGIYYGVLRIKPTIDEDRIKNWFQIEGFIKISFIYVGFALLFVFIGEPVVFWGAVSGMLLLLFLGTFVRTSTLTFSTKRLGRNYVYLQLISIMLVLGFILNGIKGLFLVTLTFLVIKDGQILRRDPVVDPVPAFDVPLVLDGIIIGIILVVSLIGILYVFLRNHRSRRITKQDQ